MGFEKIRKTQLHPDQNGGFMARNAAGPSGRLVPESGVIIVGSEVGLRRSRIDLSGKTIAVAATDDFGGTKLATFAAANLVFLGARLVATITVNAGLTATLAAGTIDIGVGTVTASNTTLATTMIDQVAKIDVPASGVVSGGGVTAQAASGDAVFINASAACAADSIITFGPGSYLDLIFVDMGV